MKSITAINQPCNNKQEYNHEHLSILSYIMKI